MKKEMTYPTAVTNKLLVLDKLPMVMDNDKEALQLAIQSCYTDDVSSLRVIRISDTAHLEDIEVSESMLDEVRANPRLEIMSESYDWAFDEAGNLW